MGLQLIKMIKICNIIANSTIEKDKEIQCSIVYPHKIFYDEFMVF